MTLTILAPHMLLSQRNLVVPISDKLNIIFDLNSTRFKRPRAEGRRKICMHRTYVNPQWSLSEHIRTKQCRPSGFEAHGNASHVDPSAQIWRDLWEISGGTQEQTEMSTLRESFQNLSPVFVSVQSSAVFSKRMLHHVCLKEVSRPNHRTSDDSTQPW